jgi:hypothetical protein
MAEEKKDNSGPRPTMCAICHRDETEASTPLLGLQLLPRDRLGLIETYRRTLYPTADKLIPTTTSCPKRTSYYYFPRFTRHDNVVAALPAWCNVCRVKIETPTRNNHTIRAQLEFILQTTTVLRKASTDGQARAAQRVQAGAAGAGAQIDSADQVKLLLETVVLPPFLERAANGEPFSMSMVSHEVRSKSSANYENQPRVIKLTLKALVGDSLCLEEFYSVTGNRTALRRGDALFIPAFLWPYLKALSAVEKYTRPSLFRIGGQLGACRHLTHYLGKICATT